ncbi:Myb-related protein B [Kipferlia bialata]|uniref:Myb-related protein B n=1 Tax=Kipferlia bialata TaxID=797122 RepID=A0A9K3GIW2_9EUKA|nr:Myb-related protein B [Kipferlia bialata]|eukprot:g6162.t1
MTVPSDRPPSPHASQGVGGTEAPPVQASMDTSDIDIKVEMRERERDVSRDMAHVRQVKEAMRREREANPSPHSLSHSVTDTASHGASGRVHAFPRPGVSLPPSRVSLPSDVDPADTHRQRPPHPHLHSHTHPHHTLSQGGTSGERRERRRELDGERVGLILGDRQMEMARERERERERHRQLQIEWMRDNPPPLCVSRGQVMDVDRERERDRDRGHREQFRLDPALPGPPPQSSIQYMGRGDRERERGRGRDRSHMRVHIHSETVAHTLSQRERERAEGTGSREGEGERGGTYSTWGTCPPQSLASPSTISASSGVSGSAPVTISGRERERERERSQGAGDTPMLQTPTSLTSPGPYTPDTYTPDTYTDTQSLPYPIRQPGEGPPDLLRDGYLLHPKGKPSRQRGTTTRKRSSRQWSTHENMVVLTRVLAEGDAAFVSLSSELGRREETIRLHWSRVLDPKLRKGHWTAEEDGLLRLAVTRVGNSDWRTVAEMIPNRSDIQARYRWARMTGIQTNTKRKIESRNSITGRWTNEEDALLIAAVNRHGAGNWAAIAKDVDGRTDQQCLRHWDKVLNPDIVKGRFTPEEDRSLLRAVEALGTGRWSEVARFLEGRTDKQVHLRYRTLKGLRKVRKGASR